MMRKLAPHVPAPLRAALRRSIPLSRYDLERYRQRNSFADIVSSDINTSGLPFKAGVIHDPACYHTHYVEALLEMGLPFQVVDLLNADWRREVEEAGCDVFFAWPNAMNTVWKQAFDERLDALVQDRKCRVYPDFPALKLYENKRRVATWLESNSIPHPRTRVFYHEEEAFEFVNRNEGRWVAKTNLGASGSGVFLLMGRKPAQRAVRQAFRRGLLARRRDPRDRQWGYLILQEYLPEVKEWRMVRIGDSYFGFRKERGKGPFHSGSGVQSHIEPPRALFDLLRFVTDRGGFRSMAMDTFETTDGSLLVNELQTVFGTSIARDEMLRRDGKPGRMLHDEKSNEYQFEAGNFGRFSCCALRIEDALNQLGHKVDFSRVYLLAPSA